MTHHRLGFAVKVLSGGGLPSHDARRWQSEPHLRISLEYLAAILERLDELDIRMYRMSSGLAPYASHPEMPQFHRQVEECADELATVGERARQLGIRLSMHPGQYTVLNSENDEVRAAAVAELEVHAALLDAMGLGAEAVIVLHVGGMAGGIEPALERFERGYEQLSDSARSRLVIENDDRSFGLAEVLALQRRVEGRVVWDILHHYCLDRAGIPVAEALRLALETWPENQRAKIHYSSPRLSLDDKGRPPKLRAHADFVDPVGFESFLLGPVRTVGRDFDVMLEAKAKDLALRWLRDNLRSERVAYEHGELIVDAGAPPTTDDEKLRAAILGLLDERDPGATICPSEAARAVAGADNEGEWRALMPRTRDVAHQLARERRIEVTQRGRVVDGESARGPVRLRRVD